MWSTASGKLAQVRWGGGAILASSPFLYLPESSKQTRENCSVPADRKETTDNF